MKSLFRKILALSTCLVLFTAVTCENEPLDDNFFEGQLTSCEIAVQNTANAALNFSGANIDNYIQVCSAYRMALQAQLQACGDTNGTLQAEIDALGDCTNVSQDPCEIAAMAVSIAETVFNQASNDNYSSLCSAYRTALQAKIEACGDADGSVQEIIDGLGNCANNNPTSTVEGEWLLTGWFVEIPIDLNNDGQPSNDLLEEMDCYNNERLVFNADGTANAVATSYADISVELEVGTTNSYDYSVECIDENETTAKTWTQEGNIVTIVDVEFQEALDFTLEGSELSIVVESGFFATNLDSSITVTEDLTFIYTKQ